MGRISSFKLFLPVFPTHRGRGRGSAPCVDTTEIETLANTRRRLKMRWAPLLQYISQKCTPAVQSVLRGDPQSTPFNKGKWPTNEFRKSQIRNFPDLNLIDLQTFRKCGTSRMCDLRTQFLWFADLKLPQVLKKHTYSLQIFSSVLCSHFNLYIKRVTRTTFRTVLIQSCAVFCRNLICGFIIKICGFAQIRNLRNCNSGMSPTLWDGARTIFNGPTMNLWLL